MLWKIAVIAAIHDEPDLLAVHVEMTDSWRRSVARVLRPLHNTTRRIFISTGYWAYIFIFRPRNERVIGDCPTTSQSSSL